MISILIISGLVIVKEINNIDACIYDYKDKLIRFHVIANSDTDEDQALKLKVRDAVIDYLQPKLENSNSIQESEKIIKKEYKNLERISKNIISKNGYDYNVKVGLQYSNFPAKQYSSDTQFSNTPLPIDTIDERSSKQNAASINFLWSLKSSYGIAVRFLHISKQ